MSLAVPPGATDTHMHSTMRPGTVDDLDLLNLLADWAPREADRRKILVDNPAQLYGF